MTNQAAPSGPDGKGRDPKAGNDRTPLLSPQKENPEEMGLELDSFVYVVSHDLRAPLRAISAFASLLEERSADKLDPESRDFLNEIKQSARKMNDLLSSLSTLSRITRISHPAEPVDFGALLDFVRSRLERDAGHVPIRIQVLQPLPTLECDKAKMATVFANLLQNAVKFTSKRPDPRIEVGVRDAGEFHEFYVRDNGIGIDPRFHDRIFQLFQHLQTDPDLEGTGTGLYTARRIIEQQGGRIWVRSEPGKGAAFHFTIPKSPPAGKSVSAGGS